MRSRIQRKSENENDMEELRVLATGFAACRSGELLECADFRVVVIGAARFALNVNGDDEEGFIHLRLRFGKWACVETLSITRKQDLGTVSATFVSSDLELTLSVACRSRGIRPKPCTSEHIQSIQDRSVQVQSETQIIASSVT
jgi:hypothetical protein